MVYFVVGLLGVICIGLFIFAVKVVRENRNLKPPKEDKDDLRH